jgi:hypothetical protein
VLARDHAYRIRQRHTQKENSMPTFEQLLKSAGVNDPHQRAKLINELRGAAADDNNDGARRPRTSEVHKSLTAAFPDLDAATVVKHLAKRGFLFDDGIESMAAAAAVTESNFRLHQQIKAAAARLGFDYRIGEMVDPFELDQALAGKDVQKRLELKNNMIRAGVLSVKD